VPKRATIVNVAEPGRGHHYARVVTLSGSGTYNGAATMASANLSM